MTEDVQVEIELSEDEVIKTSRGTQCSASPSNGTDDKPVLIKASKEEVINEILLQFFTIVPLLFLQLMQRIDAFTCFKRKQIDISNQLEFSRRTTAAGTCTCFYWNECHHLGEEGCARSDIEYHRRPNHGLYENFPN